MKPSLGKSFAAALLVMLPLAGVGILSRANHLESLKRDARENSIQQVIVFSPLAEIGASAIELPGDVRGFRDAALYARSAGYVEKWYADIGTDVKRGDLIAKIASPELDAQVIQAKADLASAKAASDLAEKTAQRWKGLVKTRTVSEQDLENKVSDADVRKAAADSAAARLGQLQALQAFEEIRAPFSGRITARNVDIGDLVQAAPSGRELFHLADSGRLRIFVQVPQALSDQIRPGMAARLDVPEHPGKRFQAEVIGNAGALDPGSRTAVVELLFDNAAGALKPGDMANVGFMAKASGTVIPITALIFRGEGLQVATIDEAKRVHLVKVVPGRDFGKTMEILSGIDARSRVIDNPPDSVMEGQQVAIASVRKLGKEK